MTTMPLFVPSAVPITFNFYKHEAKKTVPAAQPLPLDFEPSAYSVICGRGKVCTHAVGNRRLKIIASLFLQKYSNANTKEEKSSIVSEIMDMLEDACPDSRGAFVRFSNGRWWTVDMMSAREKVGALLRDCLHTKYSSSNKAKLAKRRNQRQQMKLHKKQKNGGESDEDTSDASSCTSSIDDLDAFQVAV